MSSPRQAGTWTDERVEAAKRHWAAGCSATQICEKIAEEFGPPYLTRAGVCGKLHRLKLFQTDERASKSGSNRMRPGLRRATTRPRPEPVLRVKSVARSQLGGERGEGVPVAPSPPGVMDSEIAAITEANKCTLVELSSARCKWPLGGPWEPAVFFCGSPKSSDDPSPYCPHHHMVGTQSAYISRRDAR